MYNLTTAIFQLANNNPISFLRKPLRQLNVIGIL